MVTTSRINNVQDARRLARRRLPRVVFDYIDGGADDEVTMAANEQAFRDTTFRPRMGVTVRQPDLATTVLGVDISIPLLLAPCGLVGLMHPDGAAGVARAAKRAGTISVLSTVAGVGPEELAGQPGPRWFQLYAADREIAAGLMARASSSGFDGLVVTVDTPELGKRERDLRNGMAGSLDLSLSSMARLGPQVVVRPAWSFRMLLTSLQTLRQAPMPGEAPSAMAVHAGRVRSLVPTSPKRSAPTVSSVASKNLASPITWDDVAWIREQWSGPLVVKGILAGEDAVLAAESGADAVIVSNHGGRQLDGAPASLRVLPEVVEAAGERLEVLVDGGVRRGSDIVKALALGARAVLIGRPYLYALAAAGEPGIDRLLEVFRIDMTRTLSLMGCPDLARLDGTWVDATHGPGSSARSS